MDIRDKSLNMGPNLLKIPQPTSNRQPPFIHQLKHCYIMHVYIGRFVYLNVISTFYADVSVYLYSIILRMWNALGL